MLRIPPSRLARAALTIFTLGALSGCGSDGLDTFTITEKATAVIPAGTLVEALAGDIPFGDSFLNFDITQNQEFKNQGVKKSQIDSVKLTKLTLRVVNPSDGDLTFVKSLEFNVSAEGLKTVTVATGGPFADGQKTNNLSVTGAEIRDHVSKPSMSLTTNASGKRPAKETTIEATVELKVDVNVSGLLS